MDTSTPRGDSGGTRTATPPVSPGQFDMYVLADAEGYASADQRATLEADPTAWRAAVTRLMREAQDNLRHARSLPGDERDQVVADFENEVAMLSAVATRLAPPGAQPVPNERNERTRSAPSPRPTRPDEPELQLSWEPGRVVAWVAGPEVATADAVHAMLTANGAPAADWTPYKDVPLPDGTQEPSCSAPVGNVLGWLVAAGAGQLGDDLGAGARWLGRVAVWAVELTARGSVVPLLRRRTRRSSKGNDTTPSFSVRWTPALVDASRLQHMVDTMPGSVLTLDASVDARALTRSALTGMVDAICRDGARRVEVPAAPPRVRTARDVAEAFLGRLDGAAFDAPAAVATEISARVERWARAVVDGRVQLLVQLDPPDESDAWRLAVYAKGRGAPTPIEQAIVMATGDRPYLEDELARLERMVPALLRPGAMRRGQVALSAGEAWDLMATTGPRLRDAGFEVHVPEMSRRRATPSLRVHVDAANSVVGASQLADVRWSAVFGDVELSAAEIAQLAREARPLIHSGGRWVAIDKADLQAAADALAERASKRQMSGAEMLRLALGLEESPLAGGVSFEGGGWAAELLDAAEQVKAAPARVPPGFVGELRSYQAEALAWLGFLDAAGLGGCLALDMGLGKTPTMLAHLLAGTDDGPALVIAPPAVVGNWAAEAARFTPELRVVVHHGANRAAADEIAAEVADADVILTTYGTAVRDVEAFAAVDWARVVLDEAQTIKNPANDTSQQLRRFNARSRVALTGTPIENGLGDLWAILDFTNPGLVGPRPQFIARLSNDGREKRVEAEDAMRALNGILVFRRTKAEPEIAAELPDRIDELDHCAMTPEQIGLYQAVLDTLVANANAEAGGEPRKGQILAAITALKQICNHPTAYERDDKPLDGRSGKLARLEEIVDTVFAADERMLVFTHFAEWGERLADHLTKRTGVEVGCYHGGLSRTQRDALVHEFQTGVGPGALVLSLKAGGTGLNLTAASHVVLYDRWWNPAVEDQARDRAWRIGQERTVICHRLICPGTVDERVEEVVAGKRRIADLVLPKSSSLADLDRSQLQTALGLRTDAVLTEDLTDDGVLT
jgi:superfamily II DNA or RNA helicase